MAAVLPPVLEALLRAQTMPTDEQAVSLGMPANLPMSNQAPYTPRGPMQDGRLSALTTALSGLGAPMGYQAPPEPDPRTLIIRSFTSAGDPMTPESHHAALVPSQNAGAASADMMQQFGGQAPTNEAIFSRQVQANRQLAGNEQHNQYRQMMADREQSARDLITQRAMQEANAKSLQRSGLDPRTSALLSALGQDQGGLSGMVLADALLGQGAGLRLNQQQNDVALAREGIDIKRAEAGVNKQPADGAKSIADAIRSGDQSQMSGAAAGEARAIVSRLRRNKNLTPLQIASAAIEELQTRHGLKVEQAQAAVEEAMNVGAGAFKNRQGREAPGLTDRMGDWLYEHFKKGYPSF